VWHAKRLSVFASTLQVAPRREAAGKPCKAGQPVQHPSLTSASKILTPRIHNGYVSPVRSGCNALAAPIKKTCPFEFTRHGRP